MTILRILHPLNRASQQFAMLQLVKDPLKQSFIGKKIFLVHALHDVLDLIHKLLQLFDLEATKLQVQQVNLAEGCASPAIESEGFGEHANDHAAAGPSRVPLALLLVSLDFDPDLTRQVRWGAQDRSDVLVETNQAVGVSKGLDLSFRVGVECLEEPLGDDIPRSAIKRSNSGENGIPPSSHLRRILGEFREFEVL